MNFKNCTKCNIVKEFSEFYNDKRLKCGKSSRCISCIKIVSALYNKTPEGKRKLNEYQKKRYNEGKTKSYYIPITVPNKRGRKPFTPEQKLNKDREKKLNMCSMVNIKRWEKLKQDNIKRSNDLLDELILINDKQEEEENELNEFIKQLLLIKSN